MKYFYNCLLLILPLFLFSQTEENTLFEQGKTHFYKKFQQGDEQAFKQADSIFTALKESGNFASAHQEIATELYLLRIQLSGPAEDNLTLVSGLIDKYNNRNVEAPQLYDMLLYYQQFFRYHSGKADAEEKILELIAQQLNKKKPNYEIVAITYDNLSRAKFGKSDYKKAAEYGEKAIQYCKKAGFKGMYISALQFTGGCYHWMDQVELSLQYMEKAYRLLKTLEKPNPLRMSQLAFNIAIINAGQLANKQKSIGFFKESIDYQIKAKGETDFLVMLYSLLADVYFDLKDIEQAEYYADKGYILANDILKTESVYYRSLPSMAYSRIYIAKGDFENARRVIDKVVEESIAFFGENNKFTVQAFNDKANVEREAGNYEVAEAYLLRAVQASEKVNRTYTTISAYQNLSSLYLESEDYHKAVEAAKTYKKLDSEALEGDYIGTVGANLMLAEGYMGLKVLDSAKTYLKAAQKILNNEESDTDIIVKLRALSLENNLFLEKYKAQKSIADLNQAYGNVKKLITEIIAGKASFKYNESKFYYSESIVGSINTAMEICHLKYSLKQDPEVLNTIFKLMELNKSSVLLDGINELSIKTELGVPESLIEAEASIETKLSTLNKDLYTLKKSGDAGLREENELVDQRLILNKSLDSIQAVLKADHPEYFEATAFKEPKHLSHYQKNNIGDHQALVEYYTNEDAIYRIILTKDNIVYDKITPEKEWQKTVAKLYHNLTERKEVAMLSSRMGSMLLPEFPSGVNDIIFVLDGALNQIPFEILSYREEYLINTYSISYAGSLQLYEKQMEMGKKQRFNWIGFAPEYEEALLFDNKNEVRSIGEIVNGNSVLGKDATKQKLIELGKNASILHLATHTELNKLNPMLNKILFSGDGISSELTASEIYGLQLKANLAVLSACNTGTGLFRGDGVMSMSRAFTYAGTSSTIMSLWKVPDQQTSELMELFYEFLKDGQTKSEALRNAKLTYLEQVKYQKLAHPFYWAGFVLSGDNAPIHFSEPFWKRSVFWIALLSVLVILSIVVYFKKRRNNV